LFKYSYDLVNKKLVINERETEIVRKIFTDCSRGVLLKNIATELNEDGSKNKNNMPWTVNTVSSILNNERYCGIVKIADEIYTNIVPQIIDEELFSKVGLKMGANSRRTSQFRPLTPFYLSGKLTCLHCGKPINGESDTGRASVYYYYKCQSNKKTKNTCQKKSIRRDMLEDYIIEKIEQYILQRKYIITVATEMSNNFNAVIKNDSELNLLKKEFSQNEKELQNTLSAIRMGIVTQSTKDMLEQLEEKKEQITVEIAKLSNRKPKIVDINDCADFLFSLTALDFSVAENKELLFKRFIRRIELGNRKIRIYFNPVDKPYLYSEKEDDFTPSDSNNKKTPIDSPIIGGSTGDAFGGG